VRNPIATALAAYLEISRRAGLSQWWNLADPPLPPPKYRRVSPCTQPVQRYHAFLDALEAGEPLGDEFFHAYPQVELMAQVIAMRHVKARAMIYSARALGSRLRSRLRLKLR